MAATMARFVRVKKHASGPQPISVCNKAGKPAISSSCAPDAATTPARSNDKPATGAGDGTPRCTSPATRNRDPGVDCPWAATQQRAESSTAASSGGQEHANNDGSPPKKLRSTQLLEARRDEGQHVLELPTPRVDTPCQQEGGTTHSSRIGGAHHGVREQLTDMLHAGGYTADGGGRLVSPRGATCNVSAPKTPQAVGAPGNHEKGASVAILGSSSSGRHEHTSAIDLVTPSVQSLSQDMPSRGPIPEPCDSSACGRRLEFDRTDPPAAQEAFQSGGQLTSPICGVALNSKADVLDLTKSP